MEKHPNPKRAYTVAVILILLIAGGAYLFVHSKADDSSTSTATVVTTSTPVPTTTYTNTAYGFSLKYPKAYTLSGVSAFPSITEITPTSTSLVVTTTPNTTEDYSGIFNLNTVDNLTNFTQSGVVTFEYNGKEPLTGVTSTSTTIGGKQAYKVTDTASVSKSTTYYVKNSKTVLQINVQDNNSAASDILASISF